MMLRLPTAPRLGTIPKFIRRDRNIGRSNQRRCACRPLYPDLSRAFHPGQPGWRPGLAQIGAATSQLRNRELGARALVVSAPRIMSSWRITGLIDRARHLIELAVADTPPTDLLRRCPDATSLSAGAVIPFLAPTHSRECKALQASRRGQWAASWWAWACGKIPLVPRSLVARGRRQSRLKTRTGFIMLTSKTGVN